MDRTHSFVTWLFGSLGAALLILAALTTPESVLADGGGDDPNPDQCEAAKCSVSCDIDTCKVSGSSCAGICDNSGGTIVCKTCCPCHDIDPLGAEPQCFCAKIQ